MGIKISISYFFVIVFVFYAACVIIVMIRITNLMYKVVVISFSVSGVKLP